MNPTINEAIFRDCLTRFLEYASQDPAPEEIHLAKALQTLFPGCEISVVYSWWLSDDKKNHNSKGASTAENSSAKELLSSEEVKDLFNTIESGYLNERSFKDNGVIKYQNNESESESLISLEFTDYRGRNGGNGEQLSFFLRTTQDNYQLNLNQLRFERTKWLVSYDRGLWEIYLAVKALRNASHLAQIKQKFNEIQLGKQNPLSNKLCDVEDLVDEIISCRPSLSREQYLDILDTMASWVTQIVLGTNYFKTGDASSNKGQIKKFFEKIESAQKILLKSESNYHEDRLKFFKLVSSNIGRENKSDRKKFLDTTIKDLKLEPIYQLLATWSCAYQCCELFSSEPYSSTQEDDSFKEIWKEKTEASLPILGELLSEKYNKNLSPEWLHLWFCYVLLETVVNDDKRNEGGVLSADKWRFWTKLSYVIREGLRFWEFGDKLEYVFQPNIYASALKTLVEHHAHRMVGLSIDYNLSILLSGIGSAGDSVDFQYATGYLHQSLQIYIVGHFLCSLNVSTSDKKSDFLQSINGWKIGEILASKTGLIPGRVTTKEFEQSFSLAALYHDVGLLLFPRIFYQVTTLSQNDEDLNQSLANIHNEIGGSASNLFRKAEQELRDAEYFDPITESSLDSYLKQANNKGMAEHSLLGAWYLHRVCQEVEMSSTEISRQAVRGVLLHNICTQTIDLELDPVAGLLVLCDEVFEWAPSLRSNSSYYGRLGGDIEAPNKPPQRSRAKSICLEGLEIGLENDQLKCKLQLSKEEYEKGWPQFTINLQHPDLLDADTYQIWLSVAHNIGRLKLSACSWGATIELESEIPGKLQSKELDTLSFLSHLAHEAKLPYRSRLENWVSSGNDRFEVIKPLEKVVIRSEQTCFQGIEINRLIEVLKDEYAKLT